MKIGLNLGCGTRIFTANEEIIWHNMDAVAGPNVDVVDDWRNLKKHWQSDIDVIVSHHTFEHQGCGEQPIKECHEVLKPGGSLIITVPNLLLLAGMWINHEISTQIYMTNVYGPYDGTEESRHRWGFDFDSLYSALNNNAPWSTVKPFDWRTIPGADIARDDRWILGMEAVR